VCAACARVAARVAVRRRPRRARRVQALHRRCPSAVCRGSPCVGSARALRVCGGRTTGAARAPDGSFPVPLADAAGAAGRPPPVGGRTASGILQHAEAGELGRCAGRADVC